MTDRTDKAISQMKHWSYFILSVFVLLSFLSGVIKPFGEAAFLEKRLFELTELLVEKIVGLVNQA